MFTLMLHITIIHGGSGKRRGERKGREVKAGKGDQI